MTEKSEVGRAYTREVGLPGSRLALSGICNCGGRQCTKSAHLVQLGRSPASCRDLLRECDAIWLGGTRTFNPNGRYISCHEDSGGNAIQVGFYLAGRGYYLPQSGDAKDRVLRFVRSHLPLFGATPLSAASLEVELVLADVHEVGAPSGRRYTDVYVQQYVAGYPILGEQVIFTFLGDDLMTINGAIYGRFVGVKRRAGAHLKSAAELAVATHYRSIGFEFIARRTEIAFDPLLERVIWSVVGALAPIARDPCAGPNLSQTVEVSLDAFTLSVVATRNTDAAESGLGDVLAYTPDRNSPIATGTRRFERDLWLPPAPSQNVFLLSRDVPNRSALDLYDGTRLSGAGILSPRFHDRNSMDFVEREGTSAFNAQHAFAWASYAWSVADSNLRLFPPPNGRQFLPLKVIVNSTGGSAVTGSGGCWSYRLWDTGQAYAGTCIDLCSGNPNTGYRMAAQVPRAIIRHGAQSAENVVLYPSRIGVILHEMGHALTFKFLRSGFIGGDVSPNCEANTEDEGESLKEAVAALFGYATWTQYAQARGPFPWASYDVGGKNNTGHFATDGVPVARGRGTQYCHALYKRRDVENHPLVGCNQIYHFRQALIQAYWELCNSVDCSTGAACVPMVADQNPQDNAVWSFYWAMKHTAARATYRTFVENMLGWYFQHVGVGAFVERLLMFYAHNLAGDPIDEVSCGGREFL